MIVVRAPLRISFVGGGKSYQVLDLAKLVKRITKSSSPIVVSGFRRTDTRHAVSSISKLKTLGWLPKSHPEKSVCDYAAWYKNNFLETTTL